jgi:hypothetical protein
MELREKLRPKNYMIINEFQCEGFNTNRFLKYFKEMNKGRSNADDFRNTEKFAQNLNLNL